MSIVNLISTHLYALPRFDIIAEIIFTYTFKINTSVNSEHYAADNILQIIILRRSNRVHLEY